MPWLLRTTEVGSRNIAAWVAIAVFCVGILAVLVGLTEPARPVLFVGVGLCVLGSTSFQVFKSRPAKLPGTDRSGATRAISQPARSTAGNPVERLMTNHPGRQLMWFLFVAAVFTTVGVVAEVNARGNDRNVVGGVVFILFALAALTLAAYAYINWRYPAQPDQRADQHKAE